MPTKIIHNAETGEILERELTAEELKQYKADQDKAKADAAAAKKLEDAKAALLAKLGITQEEANLLLS